MSGIPKTLAGCALALVAVIAFVFTWGGDASVAHAEPDAKAAALTVTLME